MSRILSWVGLCLVGITAAFAANEAEQRWWSHVQVLADDKMDGRDTGTPGYQRAADYVAEQFRKAGLEPAGSEGYFQMVRFKTRRIDEARSSLALIRNGVAETLTLGEDAAFGLRLEPAARVEAPLVFVGYGLNIPEVGINDLAGLPLKGAVVVYIAATPKTLSGPLQAHFNATAERWSAYRAAGAIGTITIQNPTTTDVPWARFSPRRLQPGITLADASLAETAGQHIAILMNPARADRLFAGTGHSIQELLALVDAGKPLPRFTLPARLKALIRLDRSTAHSPNVVARMHGSDPKLHDECVVLSAHLDHLGVRENGEGDRIYNGAMDNASGVAALLEIAAQLRESGIKPARSLSFVAFTGEEKGELGSRYFAAHPTVPRARIIANLNTDMFLPLFPLKILTVLGLEESDLGEAVRAVAKEHHVTVQADPEPRRNRFIRSDQYSFIRKGVPARAVKVGYDIGTPEAAIAAKWVAERYHAPSDDLSQPIDLPAAAKYVEIMRDLAVHIANRADRPRWNDTSFFKRFATGK